MSQLLPDSHPHQSPSLMCHSGQGHFLDLIGSICPWTRDPGSPLAHTDVDHSNLSLETCFSLRFAWRDKPSKGQWAGGLAGGGQAGKQAGRTLQEGVYRWPFLPPPRSVVLDPMLTLGSPGGLTHDCWPPAPETLIH